MTGGLEFEQSTFHGEAAGVARQRAIGSDHSMAWLEEPERVPAVGRTDGARRGGASDPRGELFVSDGRAVRHGPKFPPDGLLKGRAAGREGELREHRALSREIVVEGAKRGLHEHGGA